MSSTRSHKRAPLRAGGTPAAARGRGRGGERGRGGGGAMGVKGLWTLLEPVGRRIPAEALGGKRLAVDASIWLVQFLKAMRDERGEPLPHAHLLGFFRRVCKLLFLGVRPVFVFDGSTPELKRQTTAARRRGARTAAAQARRAAEKLLLVQMRRHALAAGAGTGTGLGAGVGVGSEADKLSFPPAAPVETAGDALLAQQLAAELSGGGSGDDSSSEEDLDLDFKTLDPEVLASLPPSVQLEFMEKYREHVTAENRERFQDADVPRDFSKMQMDSYIQRCEVRRKVDKIKDDMNASAGFQGAGRALPGEAGREFVLTETEAKGPAASTLGKAKSGGIEAAAALRLAQLPAGLAQLPQSAVTDVKVEADDRPTPAKHELSLGGVSSAEPGLHVKLDLDQSEHESLDAMFAGSGSESVSGDREGSPGTPVAGTEEAIEWEEVNPTHEQEKSPEAQVPAHWRERAAKRQKYWSSQYGFRMGRSLSKWSSDGGRPGLGSAEKGASEQPQAPARMQPVVRIEIGRGIPSSRATTLSVSARGSEEQLGAVSAIATQNVHGPCVLDEGQGVGMTSLVGGVHVRPSGTSGAAELQEPEIPERLPRSEDASPGGDILVTAAPVNAEGLQATAEVGTGNSEGEARVLSETETQATLPGRPPAIWEEVMGLGADDKVLEKEAASLRDFYRKQIRNMDSPTEQMYIECQDLLQMFGIPYVIAPMEAEAQCAYLNCEKLVDGVLTDDSDVFLFGGTRTYRNFFNNNKFVEAYFSPDIDKELGLDRHKLIQMALLLGSDYTSGVHGVGVVNAFEIIQAFGCCGSSAEGLNRFKKWVEAPGGVETDSGSARAAELQFKNKHRGARRNWELPENFPDQRVIKEYAQPKVDAINGPLEWGTPDVNMLRKFCTEKFGWDSAKAEEQLKPVLQATGRRDSQRRLDDFLAFNDRFVKIKSKRIQRAIAANVGAVNPDFLPEVEFDGARGAQKPLGGESQKSAGGKRKRKAGPGSTAPAPHDE